MGRRGTGQPYQYDSRMRTPRTEHQLTKVFIQSDQHRFMMYRRLQHGFIRDSRFRLTDVNDAMTISPEAFSDFATYTLIQHESQVATCGDG